MTVESFADMVKKAKQKSQQREAELVCAADIKPKPLDWLWEGHLCRGTLELLTGQPNLGKSQVQINYVACVTAGLPWPDGTAAMSPANVIMLTAEDGIDQTVGPRLIAAKADLKRVQIIKCIKTDKVGRQFLLSEDLDVLEKTIEKVGSGPWSPSTPSRHTWARSTVTRPPMFVRSLDRSRILPNV